MGLPPGPVRMPSIQVIDATLDYTRHQYMFFCAKSDFSGRHHFLALCTSITIMPLSTIKL